MFISDWEHEKNALLLEDLQEKAEQNAELREYIKELEQLVSKLVKGAE